MNGAIVLAEALHREGFSHGQDAPNHGKPWTSKDEQRLEELAEGNTPTRLIAHKLGRTEDAVRSKASELARSLKPTNQSSYNRRK